MIPQIEIRKKAREYGVPVSTIERDYAQNWLLKFLSTRNIALKGGTGIRKIYFGDYRFSDDLDFTLLESISKEDLEKQVKEVVKRTKEESGINFEDDSRMEENENGFEINVYFQIMQSGDNKTRIKIDITKHKNEKILLSLNKKGIIHPYSDDLETKVKVYSLEEIVTEKMRSLFQRTRPRDLYDVCYLWDKIDKKKVLDIFLQKCEFKGVKIDSSDFRSRKDDFKDAWTNSLQHQLKDLPDFEEVFSSVIREVGNLRRRRKLSENVFIIKVKTLTPIWTGGAERKCDRLYETGIMGSLRWWYEAIVRGLVGYACDPTNEDSRCKIDQDKFKKSMKSGKTVQEALNKQICPVCQLFGCTGWSRRFKLETDGISENDIKKGNGPTAGLKPNTDFNLKFTFLFDPSPEQKWLFKKTLWVIENYGAIGGRTTWKPNGKWGTSYGLIKIEEYGDLSQWNTFSTIDKVKAYLKENKNTIKRKSDSDWFNFNFYWIIEGQYLTRHQINKIVQRDLSNSKKYLKEAGDFDKWLGGKMNSDKAVSKKIFSFKDPNKVFGYVTDKEKMKIIQEKIRKILGKDIVLKTGKEILEGIR